jgi:hypothetical protein
MAYGQMGIDCVKHGKQMGSPDANLDVYCPLCIRDLMNEAPLDLPNPQPLRKEYSMGMAVLQDGDDDS